MSNNVELISFNFKNGIICFNIHWIIVIAISFIFFSFIILKYKKIIKSWKIPHFKINQIELGIGGQNITLSPDYLDRQIAHKLWVELNTRKIGIEIDLENDVINELYNSWYTFFQITRELIKDIPVEKIGNKSNKIEFVDLAIDVLNKGIRPHLTKWQAKYRKWYEIELNKSIQEKNNLTPQEIQRKYPDYEILIVDLKSVNKHLIYYRDQLKKISRNDARYL